MKKNKLLKLLIALWLALQSQIVLAEQGPGLASKELGDLIEKRSSTFGLWSGLRSTSIGEFMASIIQLVLAMMGVLFICLMVYGGYTWMIARGNEDKVQQAKKTITNALWGLIITLTAYAIVYFIIGYLAGGGSTFNFTAT